MPNDAIYDEVIDIINAYLNSDAYKNNWYTNDSKQNYESYITNTIGYDIINKTVTNKLKMDSQETVLSEQSIFLKTSFISRQERKRMFLSRFRKILR